MLKILSSQVLMLGKIKVLNWHILGLFVVFVAVIIALNGNDKLHGLLSSAASAGPMRTYIGPSGELEWTPLKVNDLNESLKSEFTINSSDFKADPWIRQYEISGTDLKDINTAYGNLYILGQGNGSHVAMSKDDGLTWTVLPGFNDVDDHWTNIFVTPDGRVGIYGYRVSNNGIANQRMISWSSDGNHFNPPILVGSLVEGTVITAGVVFADAQHGYAYDLFSSGGTEVFVTNTGGGSEQDWTSATLDIEANQIFGNQGSALPSGDYFIPGTKDCFSKNFGISWECMPALMDNSDLAANFKNHNDGWVGGGYAVLAENGEWVSARGWAFHTTDGGLTWSDNLIPGHRWNILQIFHPSNSKSETWLVGGFPVDLRIGGIIKTYDNGATWYQELNTTDSLYRCINKSDHVYCVGFNDNDNHSAVYRRD